MTPAPRESSRLRKLAIGLLIALVAIWSAAGGFFYFQQDQMTFPAPTRYAKGTPQDVGVPFEDLHIPVNGSEQIHAWWIPAASPSEKVLLMFHGNGYVLEQGIAGRFKDDVEFMPFHRLPANLLAIDYRGYGASSSPGSASEQRVYEDARAAFAYLTVQRRVPARNIVFVGRSIGTGPATEMATEHPEAGGLILISPFTSVPEAARAMWYLRAFPLSLVIHNQFNNLAKIGSVRIPVLIVVGSEDQITPPAMAQALFQKANEPKRLYEMQGADHNGIIGIGGQTLLNQISAFLAALN
jgi:fermentation-respiration switch protein FrsA (DUF1100 family)